VVERRVSREVEGAIVSFDSGAPMDPDEISEVGVQNQRPRFRVAPSEPYDRSTPFGLFSNKRSCRNSGVSAGDVQIPEV